MSMTTIGVNRSGHSSENFDSCLDLTHMREAIAQADYVVNALPLTADTADCVNAQVFQAMKSSAYYINVGRGKTTVSRDLVSAIQSGNIAGAALDVFDTEPLPHSDILWTLPNVICTPHTAGYSDMYTQRVLNSFLDNLNSFACDGQPKKHILNLNAGY
ncbi:NAD(P)-dependent oxidoreductase [Alloscardovia omnicolens]|nr:NAD(P)-dependent oxidoreductase [Alloscardovia omnicolens]MDK8649392.1 NAD(P)-dependent oxidoreductase [Alloscardovia omnicolens]